MDRLMQLVLAVLGAISLVLLGVSVEKLYDVGAEQARASAADEAAAKERDHLGAQIESLESRIDERFDDLEAQIDRLATSIRASQSDASEILASIGVVPHNFEIEAAVIGESAVLFPRTYEAAQALDGAGYAVEPVAPTFWGYRTSPAIAPADQNPVYPPPNGFLDALEEKGYAPDR